MAFLPDTRELILVGYKKVFRISQFFFLLFKDFFRCFFRKRRILNFLEDIFYPLFGFLDLFL